MSNEKPITISKPVRPFSPAQRSALDALMNLMIPVSQDGTMPAATSLGLYKDLSTMPQDVRAHFERGLDWLNAQATSSHDMLFAELQSVDVNTLVETQRSEDSAFISAFTLHTTGRYLQDDSVTAALGLEPRPPWPLGYEVPEGDWGLLEPVRQRGQIWRKV